MSAPENPASRRSPPEGAKKHLGRPGVFLLSAPENAAPRRSPPKGAKQHLGRPGVFLLSAPSCSIRRPIGGMCFS